MRVRFAPQAAGARNATLAVASNGGALQIALAGTGAPPLAAVPGPQGPAGPRGPAGEKGDPGPAAQLPIVTCQTVHKRTTCTTRLTALPARARVTLFRSGRVYATGKVRRGGRVRLTARRKLKAGTYALRAVRGAREVRVAVTVRRT